MRFFDRIQAKELTRLYAVNGSTISRDCFK
jgi:hypothetical protein